MGRNEQLIGNARNRASTGARAASDAKQGQVRRADIHIAFTNPRELDFSIPLNLMEREIACITVEYEDGKKERFVRTFWNEPCEVLD
jgi:hypothetical protein